MTGKATNKFSPEVRERAVRLVHSSRSVACAAIAAKIGCSTPKLLERVKRAEVDGGKRAGVPSVVEGARTGGDVEALVLVRAIHAHIHHRIFICGNKAIIFPASLGSYAAERLG